MEQAIKKAIEGGWKELPKRDTIDTCLGNATFAKATPKFTSIQKLEHWFAVNITGTSKSLEEYFLMKNVKKISKLLNLNGLANDLGITKEGVTRLIWLLDDVRNTKHGSEAYSSETISLVKNALLKERILKQTTTLLDLQPSLTKNESQPTSKEWTVKDYGIKTMEGHFVESAIEVTA